MTSCREVMDGLRSIEGSLGVIESGDPGPDSDTLDCLVERIGTMRGQISSGTKEERLKCRVEQVWRACVFVYQTGSIAGVAVAGALFGTGEVGFLLPVANIFISSLITSYTLILSERDEEKHEERLREWERADALANRVQTRAERVQRTRVAGIPEKHHENLLSESA
ncbi:MAG: hypothetical protein OXF02_04550 [Simkaniaceae bacterium]|nr:hypothetical protein [Simkaniaceae bacterium]